jgi:hypothetical protein
MNFGLRGEFEGEAYDTKTVPHSMCWVSSFNFLISEARKMKIDVAVHSSVFKIVSLNPGYYLDYIGGMPQLMMGRDKDGFVIDDAEEGPSIVIKHGFWDMPNENTFVMDNEDGSKQVAIQHYPNSSSYARGYRWRTETYRPNGDLRFYGDYDTVSGAILSLSLKPKRGD